MGKSSGYCCGFMKAYGWLPAREQVFHATETVLEQGRSGFIGNRMNREISAKKSKDIKEESRLR